MDDNDSDDDSDSDSDNDENIMDDSDSDSEDDHTLIEEEQLLIAAAIEKRDRQLKSLLERKEELPLRTRKKFDELVAELLTKTKEDIHEMICDNNIHDDDYRGIDSTRDTEAQVETAIRFFPEVITQKYAVRDEYPIQRLCIRNIKAVSFIALLVRLAIEFHSFEDHERGGLLIEDFAGDNTFRNLMYDFRARHIRPDQVDLILMLLIRLRRMGLFKKYDIRDYHLVSYLCQIEDFPERTFQFLVEWDPTSLLQTDDEGWLPLHGAAAGTRSIRGFTIVFSYVIRYYPFQKGITLLFQKNDANETPFQLACRANGRDKVMNVIEETLLLCYSSSPPPHSDNNTPPPQLNIAEALITAAIDEKIHLDCLYFLLQRQPDMLMKLLSSSNTELVVTSTNSAATAGSGSSNDHSSNGNDDDNNNYCKSKLRKRKREEDKSQH